MEVVGMDTREQKDLVIGAITGYSFDQIKPWVNSLDRCGFTGIKALVVYNSDKSTIKELVDRGYVILGFQEDSVSGNLHYPKPNFSIVVERFLHYYLFLDSPENVNSIRYVVATDVKDVIFQKNPSLFFDDLLKRDFHGNLGSIVASSEDLNYQDESWGSNNLMQSFGKIFYERHKTKTIINCGVIAAKFHHFVGLAKTLYLMSAGAPQFVPGGGGPDQAALNLLLDTKPYKNITLTTTHDHSWAAQLGTSMDPTKIEQYKKNFHSSFPLIDNDMVVNVTGDPYTIVHQWDRVPEVRAIVERKYR